MASGDAGDVDLLMQATGEMGFLVSAGSASRGPSWSCGSRRGGGQRTLPPPPLHGDFVMPHRAREEAERGPFESVGGNFPGSAIILSNPRARASVFANSVPETLHLPRDDSKRVA